jgi:GNAT superfamily N-acetyltransferase
MGGVAVRREKRSMTTQGEPDIRPVTARQLDDLAELFCTNGTTRGCWCMYFIAGRDEFGAGYGAGNRSRFEALTRENRQPMGLLAYVDGAPAAWCAAGPRSRYPRTIGPRAKVLARRDPREDDDVWLVPCFFVRVGERRAGLTTALLEQAVELAAANGAPAIEGFPRAAGQPPSPDDYLGREEVFTSCGFRPIDRPTPRRVVMRRDLAG